MNGINFEDERQLRAWSVEQAIKVAAIPTPFQAPPDFLAIAVRIEKHVKGEAAPKGNGRRRGQ